MNRLNPYSCTRILLDEHSPQLAWQAAAPEAVDVILDQDACGACTQILKAFEELTRSERTRDEALQ